MKQPALGQRWISETEPELGLGMLTACDDRMIQVRFDSSSVTRQYSRSLAPLKRIIFKPGDRIETRDGGTHIVTGLSESEGLITYEDAEKQIPETELSGSLSFSMPQDRLFAGFIDPNRLFELRCRLLSAGAAYNASPVKGFLGGQVELIPHQLYIADQVTGRFLPRVLLSDETGLGKTIEACLILHRLLITQRLDRVCIIVPESLAHQWFVELYRRFNLSFMVFDEAYCRELETTTPNINPFLGHQLAIAAMDLLSTKKRRTQIMEAGWDMAVVDEAHHMTDTEDVYGFIRALARQTDGVMLLTATPEQMGLKNHFRHLEVLDPERYFDFDTFCKETAGYKKTAQKVQKLIKAGRPAHHILDSYGPGRVIFRNRRQVVKGFPKRTAVLYPLDASKDLIKKTNREFFDDTGEVDYSFSDDPRILCLIQLVEKKKKILVICRTQVKAAAIHAAVAQKTSVDIARFDETMSLLQRDRSAAWFSRETGAQVMICSEIGSEGRNFQFVQDLFLFDLPLNPELLEQRIGRLDRIGQKKEIRIHVPFINDSVYEILAVWYMDGLNLFEKNISGLHLIFDRFRAFLTDLFDASKKTLKIDRKKLETLIQESRTVLSELEKTVSKDKNILLEMNSFNPKKAGQLVKAIRETADESGLEDLMTATLDHYGIETDQVNPGFFKLLTTDLVDEKFPLIKTRSEAVTFRRRHAVVRDDVEFLSWDHPLVQQTMDFFITERTGSCALALLDGTGKPGLVLETLFVLECVAPKTLDLDRYLMPEPIRILVDHHTDDVTNVKAFQNLSKRLVNDTPGWFKDMEAVKQDLLPAMIDKSIAIAGKRSEAMIREGEKRVENIAGREIRRLNELKKINPNIRESEIRLAQERMAQLLAHLSKARPRLDALRLIRIQ